MRNLNRWPEAWEEPLVHACIWSPTRGFLQVRNLTNAVSVGELSSSAQALLIPREFTPEDFFSALSVNSASVCTSHWTSESPQWGETPASVYKASYYDFLTLQRSHTCENLYICLECGKNMSWRAALGLHQRNPVGGKTLQGLWEKLLSMISSRGTPRNSL